MSRQAQLPPRCPLQKKTTAYQADVLFSHPTCTGIELNRRHHGGYTSMPQSFMLEEHPAWLSDLLSDSDANSSGTLHRRSASDSLTLSHDLGPLKDLDQLNETETVDSCGPDNILESGCVYGPNSPRRKNKLAFPEKEIASAFSDYVVQNPLLHLDGYISAQQSHSFGDVCALTSESNTENNQVKRHPGQRSRVRKLQYIAELERTVTVLQNLGAELTVRVGSLAQQYAALSMQNNTLKQQLLRMQQEKFVVDGEYQSLQKEMERLKAGVAVSFNNKLHNSRSHSAAAGNFAHSDAIWNTMLDMRKLDLN